MKIPLISKPFIILTSIAVLCTGLFHCSHREGVNLTTGSAAFNAYSEGFTALIEKQISKKKFASKPVVTILGINENFKELRIRYEIKYDESFPDGEKVDRHSTGQALLKKSAENAQWVLMDDQGASHTMSFTKGSVVGG